MFGIKDKAGITAWADALKANTSITELNLAKNGINANDAKILAPAISDNAALSVLSLKGNKLGTKEAGKALGVMLKGNSLLKELDLSDNWVYGGDTAGFAQGISKGLPGNGALSALNLASNNLGKIVLAAGWRSKDGDGYHPWVGPDGQEQHEKPGKPDGIIAIANAIPDMGALTCLNLASNSLGVKGAKTIVACLPKCT
jgi:hypothetical protein